MSQPSQSPLDDEPLLSEHSYDGIQEYDNPTPGWWNWLFIGTVVWSAVYIVWFHSPVAKRLVADQYSTSFAANIEKQFGDMGEVVGDEATLLKWMNTEKAKAVGASTFAVNCASCHGADGGGISGPNLTDEKYKNVKQIADIVQVLQKGANNGAMPAWENRLHPTALVLTAAYVASMRGKNSPKARPLYPGEVDIPAWPAAPAEAAPAEEAKPAAENTQALHRGGPPAART